ncbi:MULTISPECIES: PrgI family protein [unclassified Sporosarcina]|uniref:PrgI family protein n=1 Tax=unclassified Sporosarcina TaxID=2647733 RepID=UPI001A91966B|nr:MULTISPECIES: PrgI family protein [unclassified Sporosarcina]MBO0588397.1 PrgI family protein [Sporosarcina sp. E16_8]MBO0601907.1 PrgI family protein [Sporosarcina sp. E16_3]
MNEIVVPIDLTEEEKTILAVLSVRQFILIVPAGVFSMIQLLLFNLPFVDGLVDVGLRFIIFLVINTTTLSLAFIKLDRRDQYLSEFIFSKVFFMRSQKIYKA